MFYDDLLVLSCMLRLSLNTTIPPNFTVLFDNCFMVYGMFVVFERLFKKRLSFVDHLTIVLCMLQLVTITENPSFTTDIAYYIQTVFHTLYMVGHYIMNPRHVKHIQQQLDSFEQRVDHL